MDSLTRRGFLSKGAGATAALAACAAGAKTGLAETESDNREALRGRAAQQFALLFDSTLPARRSPRPTASRSTSTNW